MNDINKSAEAQTQNKASGSIWSWIIGFLLILGSLSGLSKNPLASILCIVAGAFILPPVTKFLGQKLKKQISRAVKVIVVIVALVIAGSSLPDPAPSADTQAVVTPPKVEQPKEEMNLEVSYLPNQKGFSVPVIGIKNKGTVAWEDCTLRLNDRTYTKEMSIIVTEDTFKETMPESEGSHYVMAPEFVTKEGTRFNPYSAKPIDLSISCKKPTNGFGYWKFN